MRMAQSVVVGTFEFAQGLQTVISQERQSMQFEQASVPKATAE